MQSEICLKTFGKFNNKIHRKEGGIIREYVLFVILIQKYKIVDLKVVII